MVHLHVYKTPYVQLWAQTSPMRLLRNDCKIRRAVYNFTVIIYSAFNVREKVNDLSQIHVQKNHSTLIYFLFCVLGFALEKFIQNRHIYNTVKSLHSYKNR